jgi:hypothetical protein
VDREQEEAALRVLRPHRQRVDALEKGEIESDSSDDDDNEAERCKRVSASVDDLSRLNAVDGEYAVAVYPVGVYPQEEKVDDAAAAVESSC